MKIVDRKTFLAMPAGVFFCKGYGPPNMNFDGLAIKGDTIGNDFVTQELDMIEYHDTGEMMDRIDEMRAKGTSYPIYDGGGRDGLFDENAEFLIFEKADLLKLKGWVEEALARAEG